MIFFLLCGKWEIIHLAELAKRHFSFIKKAKLISCIQPSGCRKPQLLRHQNRACMVDHHTFFDIAQLAGVIICAPEVIAMPAVWYRRTVNATVGEQHILAEQLNVLEFFCSCINLQKFIPPICGVYVSSCQLFRHPSKRLTRSVAVRAIVGGSVVSEKLSSCSSNQQ